MLENAYICRNLYNIWLRIYGCTNLCNSHRPALHTDDGLENVRLEECLNHPRSHYSSGIIRSPSP